MSYIFSVFCSILRSLYRTVFKKHKSNKDRNASELSNLIFHNRKNYITSSFGYRDVISTSKGDTNAFHDGVDYGTNRIKLPQYPVDNGIIIACGADDERSGAKYVWIEYPQLGVKMIHYHLDTIKVKTGQTVNRNTILGYTGKTGKVTGIHLHLGVKLLSGGGYIDPEAWFENYKEKESKELCLKESKEK